MKIFSLFIIVFVINFCCYAQLWELAPKNTIEADSLITINLTESIFSEYHSKEHIAVQVDRGNQITYLIFVPAQYETSNDTFDMASRFKSPPGPYRNNPLVYKKADEEVEFEFYESEEYYSDISLPPEVFAILGFKIVIQDPQYSVISSQEISEDSIVIVPVRRMIKEPQILLTNDLANCLHKINRVVTLRQLKGTWEFRQIIGTRTCFPNREIIQEAQIALVLKGYNVPVNNVLDSVTRQELLRFQEAQGLKANHLLSIPILKLLDIWKD